MFPRCTQQAASGKGERTMSDRLTVAHHGNEAPTAPLPPEKAPVVRRKLWHEETTRSLLGEEGYAWFVESAERSGGKSKNYACTARGSRYLDCPQAAVLVSKSAVSHCVPELLAVTRETQSPQAACSLSRPLSTDAHHHCIGIPAALSWLGRGQAPYSVGSAYLLLPVSSGSASLAEP